MSFPAWIKRGPPAPTEARFGGWVQQAFAELTTVLESWHRGISYGPVDGAYYPLSFHRHSAALGAVSVAHLVPMVPGFSPVAVSAWCDTGTLTAKLVYDGPNDLLSANLSVSSTPVRLSGGADFAVDSLPPGTSVWLEIVSVDSGAPTELVVHLLVKRLSRAEG